MITNYFGWDIGVIKPNKNKWNFHVARDNKGRVRFAYAILWAVQIFAHYNPDMAARKRTEFRNKWHERIRHLQVWPVWGVSWSRDCDMCESTSIHLYPTYWHLARARREQWRWAEGPCSLYQVSRKEAKRFKPEFRDRIAEAWDNGNTSPFIV